ncbi:MAG TPA: ATP-dependent DNA helicase, partial [Candidatus Thermoplasmatota archaeon]|nr:ATP-dependent DNA helicase [Candidatus Thermoplasmatota archaeon]
MFCPTCKGLLSRRKVRAQVVAHCPRCDGETLGTTDRPLAWWTGKQTAHIPNADRRAAKAKEPRAPKELPAPEKIDLPPGADLFPFGSVREGQRQFLADVAQAAKDGKHLLAHAPTGLGKTVSTLAPLVAYALANGKRVFFLTSKQSQHKIAIDTLKAIREKAGAPFVVSDIIGKQDMCPRREARDLFSKRFAEFCRREVVSKSCEYFENDNKAAIKILKQRPQHVEELVITSTDCVVCPHQTALDLAAQAHVVVCDYNYFFSDMRAQMAERLRLDLSDVILVVDEAHNLPDRIRDHLTLRLDEYVLDEAVDEAKDLGDEVLQRRIDTVREVLGALALKEFEPEPRDVSRAELVEGIDDALARGRITLTATKYDDLLELVGEAIALYEQEFKADSTGLARLAEFLSNWKIERRGVARILEAEPTPSLRYHILDPAVLAKPVFDAVHASVVMSGTLHPLEMTRDVLGLDAERSVLRVYESPFPRENRLVVFDTAVTTGYKERTPEMFRDIAERLASVALATPGNVAAFFPSYALLEQVRPTVERALRGRKKVFFEERGLDKSEKEGLVEQMRRGLDDTLLMGVMAGS